MADSSKRTVSPPLVRRLLTPFEAFTNTEALGGLLLAVLAASALLLANSPLADRYFALRDLEIAISAGHLRVHASLQHLINDALMALFFFVVGLEIKRELLIGELTSRRKALLPVAGAIGGMVAPASIYALFNFGRSTISGWAIPMATDIAFALGILSLFGHRIPMTAKVFLTSLAIIDDLGAVIVIATFYAKDIVLLNLGIATLLIVFLFTLNRLGTKNAAIYGAVGIAVWFFCLGSGVHATIAGVAVAATIPVWSKIDPEKFRRIGEIKLQQFAEATDRTLTPLIDADQGKAIHELHSAVQQVQPPMMAMQYALHPWSTFVIMPLFAFFNAGVAFAEAPIRFDALTLGILGGLLLGKPLGVLGGTWLAIKLGLAEALPGVSRRQFYAIAMFTGIGFTMSVFITNLAFSDKAAVNGATGAVLLSSLLAVVIGAAILLMRNPFKKSSEPIV